MKSVVDLEFAYMYLVGYFIKFFASECYFVYAQGNRNRPVRLYNNEVPQNDDTHKNQNRNFSTVCTDILLVI